MKKRISTMIKEIIHLIGWVVTICTSYELIVELF